MAAQAGAAGVGGPGAQPDLQQRMQTRLKNSTPEQRVEGDRVRLERKRQQQAAQQP
jgi:hypothetical protein